MTNESKRLPVTSYITMAASLWKPLSALLFIAFLLSDRITEYPSDAQYIPEIPENEVKSLQIVSNKLKNSYWNNINRNSCNDGGRSFNRTFPMDNVYSRVICDCSFSKGFICHVTEIQLKGLNLSGTFPVEFGNLPKLRVIELSRNYINGMIPRGLSKIPLIQISLVGNQITGTIPDEIGLITSLEQLDLEDNQLGGHLPSSLGNLKNLTRMIVAGNNFNGTIPESFSNLRNLQQLRLNGNDISGKIPDFIGNFTKLNLLEIQGTSMLGPIPSSFSLLTNMTNLRISDLNTTSMAFPNLSGMTKLVYLVLRNCLITDVIPDYIQNLSNLRLLDLSFNQLSGPVPDKLGNLQLLYYLFLSNNLLSGPLPNWLYKLNDLSFNNFSSSSESTSCQQQNVNLIASYSSAKDAPTTWCLRKDLPCPRKARYHSLFINYGGDQMSFQGHSYEGDTNPDGPSTFMAYGEKWAYSSTGVYKGNEHANFIVVDKSIPNVTDIYQTARIAPVSLTYYGLCLRTGSYNVKLHFAEIELYKQNFSSIGKRLFDIVVQGNVVKDFNIAAESGGVGKVFIKEYKNVYVHNTLEIHLYWAGKGTTEIPKQGTYGPIISGIAVTPNFRTGLSAGAITGIVLASCVVLLSILVILRKRGYLGRKGPENEEFQGLNTGYFTMKQIKAATGDFNMRNKIGEGGFGPVYKGILPDGKVIAVKKLSSKSKQGNREFINEIGMISALQHPNLVTLYGCCIEGKELLLVYEYMDNNSLAHVLFDQENQQTRLEWRTRKMICLGVARGLAYLHESRLKIVHRDIKATNVLLDRDWNAKISDFGLARLYEEENTHISTRIAGTIGYMAPEYAMRGYLTDKADVYSFGVVLLETVSGKSNASYGVKEEFVYLLDWAYVLQEKGSLIDLVDPRLGSNYSTEEALRLLNLALLCTNPSPTLRPSMSSVVSMIDGKLPVVPQTIKHRRMNEELLYEAFKTLSHNNQTQASGSSQQSRQVQRSISMDGRWTSSSVSL